MRTVAAAGIALVLASLCVNRRQIDVLMSDTRPVNEDPMSIVWGGSRFIDVVPRGPFPIRHFWLMRWMWRNSGLTAAFVFYRSARWCVRHPRTVTAIASAVVVGFWMWSWLWAIAVLVGVVAGFVGYRRWRPAARAGAAPLSVTAYLLGAWRKRTNLEKNWHRVADQVVGTGQRRGGDLPDPKRVETIPGGLRWVVDVGAAGLVSDDLAKHNRRLAGILGGGHFWNPRPRVVETRDLPLEAGLAEQYAYWGDPLDRVYRLSEMPPAPVGHAVIGVKRNGAPVMVDLARPVLIVGQMGSGKSKAARALMASTLQMQMPVEWRVADSGHGVEWAAYKRMVDAGERHGLSFNIGAYAGADPAETKALIEATLKSMKSRAKALALDEETEHAPSLAYPKVMLYLDELFLVKQPEDIQESPLAQIQSQARKLGYGIVASTQIAHASVLKELRYFFTQRIVLSVNSQQVSTAALDDNADALGFSAKMISLRHPGVGIFFDQDTRSYDFFRCFYVDDAEYRLIGQGRRPEGLQLHAPTVLDRSWAVYTLLNAQGLPIYVGKARRPEVRWRQHRERQPWRDEIADIRVRWYPSHEIAKEREISTIKAVAREAAARGYRLKNKQHNGQWVTEEERTAA